jgi:glycosyltransferase involved in cell wall biosynthesis
MADRLGLIQNVKFEGSLYGKELAIQIMSSGIYILAGMGGLSINEAMAFGKPVICSICDGTEKRLVREGYNGLYFKSGDSESLSEKIKYLFRNTDLIGKMGENSEYIIKNEMNLEIVSREFLRCFEYVYEKKLKLKD